MSWIFYENIKIKSLTSTTTTTTKKNCNRETLSFLQRKQKTEKETEINTQKGLLLKKKFFFF